MPLLCYHQKPFNKIIFRKTIKELVYLSFVLPILTVSSPVKVFSSNNVSQSNQQPLQQQACEFVTEQYKFLRDHPFPTEKAAQEKYFEEEYFKKIKECFSIKYMLKKALGVSNLGNEEELVDLFIKYMYQKFSTYITSYKGYELDIKRIELDNPVASASASGSENSLQRWKVAVELNNAQKSLKMDIYLLYSSLEKKFKFYDFSIDNINFLSMVAQALRQLSNTPDNQKNPSIAAVTEVLRANVAS